MELLIGLGACLNWIAVIKYFAYSKSYSTVMKTLKEAIPMNVRLYVGIVPIFIGYALLCVTVFWNDRHYFTTFADSCYTLFAMMNGDSILDNFQATSSKNFFLG